MPYCRDRKTLLLYATLRTGRCPRPGSAVVVLGRGSGSAGRRPRASRGEAMGLQPDVRTAGPRTKGGRARPTLASELVNYLTQGVVGVSELGGDLAEGTPLDEVGPQRFVASVEGVVGLQEVVEAEGVVHDPDSEL